MGWGREIGCMREMADALWEGHTLLKTRVARVHAHTHAQTDRQTDKSETVYPPDLAGIINSHSLYAHSM